MEPVLGLSYCPLGCSSISCSVMSTSLKPHGLQSTRLLCPWASPSKNTGVGCHFLLQAIFWTQGSNLGLLHCRQILYCLSHQGSLLRPYCSLLLPRAMICSFIQGVIRTWEASNTYSQNWLDGWWLNFLLVRPRGSHSHQGPWGFAFFEMYFRGVWITLNHVMSK